MTFLFLVLLFTAIPIALICKRVRRAAKTLPSSIPVFEIKLLAFSALVLVSLTTLAQYLPVFDRQNWSWSPILLGMGAAGTGASSFWRVIRRTWGQRSVSSDWSWSMHLTVLQCVLAFYLVFVVLDHEYFWSAAPVAVLPRHVYLQSGISCSYPFVLAKPTQDGFQYRCPSNLSMGNMRGQPFVPWPTYSTGSGTNFGALMDLLERDKQL